MVKKPLVSIIIPVYNEFKTAEKLLNQVYNYKSPSFRKELIIVESNSTDGSRQAVKNFALGKKNVTLILERRPSGKGVAVRKGLKAANGSIFLIQDADLEYDVNDYEKLIAPIIHGKAAFVLGSRHLKHDGKTDWLIRRFKGKEHLYAQFMNFGGLFFHSFFNFLYGTKLSDPTTMYKVFKRDLLKQVHLEGRFFELDWEIVAKFIRLGYIPLEVPVRYISRGISEGKKIKFSRDVLTWVNMICKVRFLPIDKL